MAVEIERKFLVNHQEWNSITKPIGANYKQGYILKDILKTIRIRVADDKGFITVKGKVQGISRLEYEYPIPVSDAEEMLAKFCVDLILKTRYNILYAGKIWEVDEFWGANEGLIMAEIELIHEDEQFELPGWISTEVTGDDRYYNSSLLSKPYTSW